MISRRDFIKSTFFSLGAGMIPGKDKLIYSGGEWPKGVKLARNCVGGMINLRSKPSATSDVLDVVYEDTVIPWYREVVGDAPPGLISRRWVETDRGYLYSPSIQPVWNKPNEPLLTLPKYGEETGMWAEVSVPYVDLKLINKNASSPWFKEVDIPRLYYSQVVWIDEIGDDENGDVFYKVSERYGSYGDVFWARASAFRPVTPEEIEPITPEVENKRIVVDLDHQYLSCFEDDREIYYCKVSTGAKFNAAGEAVDEWATPVGPHPIWRKLVSIHMSGGGTGAGWDTPGVAWTSLFAGDGVAIHSTFWHSDYGTPRSHGCVNTKPEDAKWIFRWSSPVVPYDPGDITVQMPGGTIVDIVAVS